MAFQNIESFRHRKEQELRELEKLPDDQRVVIIGAGIVSPIGNNVGDYWDSLLAGDNGFTPLEEPELWSGVQVVGRVGGFDLQKSVGVDKWSKTQRNAIKRSPDAEEFLLAAMHESLAQAQMLNKAGMIDVDSIIDPRMIYYQVGSAISPIEEIGDAKVAGRVDLPAALIDQLKIASGLGNQDDVMALVDEILTLEVNKKMNITNAFRAGSYRIPSAAGQWFNIQGGYSLETAACATMGVSLSRAYKAVRYGNDYPVAVIGATETVDPLVAKIFSSIRALATEKESYPLEPIDGENGFVASEDNYGRNGFVPAEGSAVLTLATLEFAKWMRSEGRDIQILGELHQGSLRSDGSNGHDTKPNVDAQIDALEDAIAHVPGFYEAMKIVGSGHFTATGIGDAIEPTSWRDVLGEYDMLMRADKANTGHPLGVAAGFQAIAALKMLESGIVPGNIRADRMDQELVAGLNFPSENIEFDPELALVINAGFGGVTTAVAITKYLED